MFAQMIGQRTTQLLKLLCQNFLHIGFTPTTSRACLRAEFHLLQCSLVDAKFLDYIGNLTTSDIIAGADLGVGIGGELFFYNLATACRLRCEQHCWILGQGTSLHGKSMEFRVVTCITNENTTTELGTRLIENEFAIDATYGIIPNQVGYIRIIRTGLILTK